MNQLKQWMGAATAQEKKLLAEYAETTPGTLRQATGGYKSEGEVRLSAGLAQKISDGTKKLQRKGLTPLKPEDLCPACASCEYMRRCHK